jgi:hypothetical protein
MLPPARSEVSLVALLGFLAYLLAEELGLSGIFSIFFAGLTMRQGGGRGFSFFWGGKGGRARPCACWRCKVPPRPPYTPTHHPVPSPLPAAATTPGTRCRPRPRW